MARTIRKSDGALQQVHQLIVSEEHGTPVIGRGIPNAAREFAARRTKIAMIPAIRRRADQQLRQGRVGWFELGRLVDDDGFALTGHVTDITHDNEA